MCIVEVMVEDNIVFVVICQNLIVELDVSGMAFIFVNQIDNSLFDVCGIVE